MIIEQTLEEEPLEELAKHYAENFVNICETEYGKDEMTDGEKPYLALFKACYENYKMDNKLNDSFTIEEMAKLAKK